MQYTTYDVYYTTKDAPAEEYTGKCKHIRAISPLDAMHIFKRKYPEFEIVAVI